MLLVRYCFSRIKRMHKDFFPRTLISILIFHLKGKKSEVAAKAVKLFNRSLRIEALSERVGADTENVFTDDFFNGLNGVLNALDNVDASMYQNL